MLSLRVAAAALFAACIPAPTTTAFHMRRRASIKNPQQPPITKPANLLIAPVLGQKTDKEETSALRFAGKTRSSRVFRFLGWGWALLLIVVNVLGALAQNHEKLTQLEKPRANSGHEKTAGATHAPELTKLDPTQSPTQQTKQESADVALKQALGDLTPEKMCYSAVPKLGGFLERNGQRRVKWNHIVIWHAVFWQFFRNMQFAQF